MPLALQKHGFRAVHISKINFSRSLLLRHLLEAPLKRSGSARGCPHSFSQGLFLSALCHLDGGPRQQLSFFFSPRQVLEEFVVCEWLLWCFSVGFGGHFWSFGGTFLHVFCFSCLACGIHPLLWSGLCVRLCKDACLPIQTSAQLGARSWGFGEASARGARSKILVYIYVEREREREREIKLC